MAFFQDIIMPRWKNLFFQIMIILIIDHRELNNGQMDKRTILLTLTLVVLNCGAKKYSLY